jgi:hypothetical protein
MGECRRFPPNKLPEEEEDGVFGQWIETEGGQWCGEFTDIRAGRKEE